MQFIKEFSKKYWEKKPVLYKNLALSVSEIDAQDIFNFLLRYSDHCRKNKTTEGLKLYVDGQLQYESELLQALPVKTDQNFKGYHFRMRKIYEDYCLVCDELSQGAGEKWQLIRSFLAPLYQEVGIPNKYAEVGLYLGNYKKTPFGVHVDGCGVFSFPVVGSKKFRIWDPKFVEKNPDLKESFTYDSYKRQSQLLEVGPKDMAYWPSNAWHIAESDGSFSATWSIGLWLDESVSEVVSKKIKTIFSDEKTIKPNKKSGAAHLPLQLSEAVSALKKVSKEELEDALMQAWLITESKAGFKSAPLPRKGKLNRKEKFITSGLLSFLWYERKNGSLCIAVNGVLLEVKKTTKFLKLIQSIVSGQSFTLDKLDSSEFKIIQCLYENYAIARV